MKINANEKKRKKERKRKSSKAPGFRLKKRKMKIYYISTDPLQQNQKTKTIKVPARSFFSVNHHHHLDQSNNH
jgi:hypothetical protein